MKTLIFNGSTRKDGDTEALIHGFTNHLKGEIKIISCLNDIKPCSDCRYCWKHSGCSINDDMQELYPYIQECDNIVIASPIWFASLSGPMINMASRLQTIYSSVYFRKTPLDIKKKNGVIIISGARRGTEETPVKTAVTIMKFLNVRCNEIETIYSLNTDSIPAEEDLAALSRCREVAESLNRLSENAC